MEEEQDPLKTFTITRGEIAYKCVASVVGFIARSLDPRGRDFWLTGNVMNKDVKEIQAIVDFMDSVEP